MRQTALQFLVGGSFIMGCLVASAQPMTPGAAANEARTLGASKNATTKADINVTKKDATLPTAPAPRDCMPTSATVESYYGGGNGDLSTPTGPLLSSAVTETTPECAAINYMQGRSTAINPITINPADPLVVGGRSITADPGSSLGVTAGIFTPRPTSSCAPGSVTTGGDAVEQVCYEYAALGNLACDKNWLLSVAPWWQYACEKTPYIMVDEVCTKEEWVIVEPLENCLTGSVVANQDVPWVEIGRSGPNLYQMGGYIKAMCNPALATEVQFNVAVQNVSEGGFGSQCCHAPDPNRDLMPPNYTMQLPSAISTEWWFRPSGNFNVAFMGVAPGSGCDASGNCNYSGFTGNPAYRCDPGFGLQWQSCTYDVYNGTTTCTPWNGASSYSGTNWSGEVNGFDPFGAVVSLRCAAAVVGPATLNPFCDFYNGTNCDYSCTAFPGTVLDGTQCRYPWGAQPHLSGPGSGSKAWALSFQKPGLVPTITSQGVNSTCGLFEGNPACSPNGSRCIDGPNETRVVNGLAVNRACWKSELDFQCKTSTGPDYCAPLEAEPLCAQLGVDSCASYNADGTCRTYNAAYKCTKDMGPPVNVTQTGSGYDITQDSLDTSACDALSTNPSCTLTSSVCADSADRTFYGFTFSRTCWKYVDSYTCPATTQSSCTEWEAAGCTLIPGSTACTSTLPDGTCGTTQKVYQCGTPATTTTTGSTCDSTPYCINGICYDTSRPGDPDFGQAVAMMEASREMGTYIDQDTFEIFKGAPSKCRHKLFGLNNCCKSTSGGGGSSSTNAAIYQATSFGKAYLGSSYMYDSLFASDMPNMLFNALDSSGVVSWSGANTYDLYGLQLGWDGGGLTVTGFDPYSFAAAIAIQYLVTELTTCPADDQLTAMKKSMGICQYIGSYCSKKFLGSCQEEKEGYCCFNSKLAKAINIQGKKQLGLPLGSGQSPDCSGLTIAEIQSLDFSTIDLSEFIADIVPGGTSPSEATASVVNRLAGYAPVAPVVASSVPAGTPPPPVTPPPPSTPWAEPTVTAAWSPNPALGGGDVTLTTNTTNAQNLSYDCSGAFAASGVIPTGPQATTVTIPPGAVGEAVCFFTATNPDYDATIQVNLSLGPNSPTISASFSPATVDAGGTYTFTVTSANADAVSYACTGGRTASGSIPPGTYTSPPQTATAAEVGLVLCTFTARNTATGVTANASVSQNVNAVLPTLTATAAASPITAGTPLVVNTVTTQAVSVDYTCSGAVTGSGSLAVPNGTLSLPTTIANVGIAVCSFTATSASGGTANRNASIVINP